MDPATTPGPTALILVRHGESMGNRAASDAETAGAEVIEVDMRDADVPLSPTGVEQAEALGARLAQLTADERPDAVWASPYRRALETARIAVEGAGLDLRVRSDERLRDRELGVLDLLTTKGVLARFPEEAARRRWLGKFYHRPPGGESWADVAARLRGFLADLDRHAGTQRILVVSHDAVVVLARYICEQLTEDELLQQTANSTVLNASYTELTRTTDDGGGPEWAATVFNDVTHLESLGVDVTRHSGDPHVEPR